MTVKDMLLVYDALLRYAITEHLCLNSELFTY